MASNILAVESAMSTSRQIWRLFKWASIYAKRRNSLAAVPQLPDIAGLLSDLGMFGYYLSDNYSFLCKVGVTRGNVGIASRRAARFWLAAVLAGLVGSVIKAVELHRRQQVAVRRITEARAKKNDGDGDEQTEGAETTSPDECIPPPELRHLVRLKRAALALCAKHLSDAIVASSLSRENQAHPAIVGACGVVSSIVGCWQVWPRHTRSGTIG